MSRYELIYIIDTSVEEEARKELIERFSAMITDNGGTVDKVDEWGKRRLAYPINYKTEGYYVLVNFSGEAELPREIERNLEIHENVLRYLIVKLLTKKASVKPRAVRVMPEAVAPKAEEPEAPKPEAPKAEAPAEPVAETPAE